MQNNAFLNIMQTVCLVVGVLYPILAVVGLLLRKLINSEGFLSQYSERLAVLGTLVGIFGILLRWGSWSAVVGYVLVVVFAMVGIEYGIEERHL